MLLSEKHLNIISTCVNLCQTATNPSLITKKSGSVNFLIPKKIQIQLNKCFRKVYLFLLKIIGLCFYELLIIICQLFIYDSDYFIHHRSQNGWYNWSFLKEVIKVVELYYVVFWDWCKLLGILETSMVSWKSY